MEPVCHWFGAIVLPSTLVTATLPSTLQLMTVGPVGAAAAFTQGSD
jgi:hypothetical protein